jgi:two-component system, OmpR family, sensor kinase
LAQRRQRTVEHYQKVLDEIQTDVTRLSDLADRLLDLGSLSQSSPPPESADLATVARAEVDRRHLLAPEDSPYREPGSLRAVTSTTPVAVDVSRLQQLVNNLLDNAAIHGLPPVTVTVDQRDGLGRLMVSDRGGGMDEEMLASAPQRFARAPGARSRPGSGLGLALVYAIVAASGGELRLCFQGHHQSFGRRHPFVCDHGADMTVTVLLPASAKTSPSSP